MGHYQEMYDAMEEESERRRQERLDHNQKRFPDDPSQWGISLAERVKRLEQIINRLEHRLK